MIKVNVSKSTIDVLNIIYIYIDMSIVTDDLSKVINFMKGYRNRTPFIIFMLKFCFVRYVCQRLPTYILYRSDNQTELWGYFMI